MEIFGLIKNSADNDADKQTTRKHGATGVVNRGVGGAVHSSVLPSRVSIRERQTPQATAK